MSALKSGILIKEFWPVLVVGPSYDWDYEYEIPFEALIDNWITLNILAEDQARMKILIDTCLIKDYEPDRIKIDLHQGSA